MEIEAKILGFHLCGLRLFWFWWMNDATGTSEGLERVEIACFLFNLEEEEKEEEEKKKKKNQREKKK